MQEIDFHRALHRPGTIIDAGAHDGRLTLPLAALLDSHVIAFEPLPAALARLRRNLERAGIATDGTAGAETAGGAVIGTAGVAGGSAAFTADGGPVTGPGESSAIAAGGNASIAAGGSGAVAAAGHAGRAAGKSVPVVADTRLRPERNAPLRRDSARVGTHGATAGGPASRVTLRPEALSDRQGTIALAVPRVGGVAQEEWASVAKDYDAIRAEDPRVEAVDTFVVPTLPLDALALSDVTAMKIDVEGAEQEALQGALATLRRCRPVLSIEIEERHRTGSTRAVPALLRPLGYRGFFEFYGDWRPIESLDIATMQRASPSPAAFEASHPYVFSFYFVPEERLADLAVLARLP